MAITKLKPITKTLQKAVNYIISVEKTSSNELLVSSFECNTISTEFDFKFTKELAKAIKGDYSNVGGRNILAWQIIQSFAPEDNITPEQAHKIGEELAEKFLKNKYQYVISTHIDKGHIHNHIIFNSTSFKTLKNFRVNKNLEYLRLRNISNNICKENNLSIIDYPDKKFRKNKNLVEIDLIEKDKSFKNILIEDIDEIISKSISFEKFLLNMKALGYEIIDDKNGIGFKNSNQKYFTRLKSLDENYSKEKIEERIRSDKSLKNKFDKVINEKTKNIYSNLDLVEPKEILKSKISWREKLRYCIDYFVFKSKNYEEFLQGMQDTGYTINFGKHISFRCKGMDKNIRAKVLGENYTEEKIKERILEQNKILPKIPIIKKEKNLKKEKIELSIKSLINTEENEKYKNSIAYKRFVEKFNANQTIAIINFMRENNYDDIKLKEAISELENEKIKLKKDLEILKTKFKKLDEIERTEENNEDYDKALKNLNNLKSKVDKKLEDITIKLLEHKIVEKNRDMNLKINKDRNL